MNFSGAGMRDFEGKLSMTKNNPEDDKAKIPEVPSSAPPPATKIRITEDADATGDTLAAYDYWRAGSGRRQVPGIIKCFGARPDFLRQVVEFSNTVHFSEGHLSRRQKEMIASYVSYLNRCPY
jgi:Carboxymuconolactone decarboxylase family